jgi:hypothetical protein
MMERQLWDNQIKQGKNVNGNFLQKKSPKDCSLVRYGNSAQGQTIRPAERIPVTYARLEGKSQCSHHVCAG